MTVERKPPSKRAPRQVRGAFPTAWGSPRNWVQSFQASGPRDNRPPNFVGIHTKHWERAINEAEAGAPGGLIWALTWALDRHSDDVTLKPDAATRQRIWTLLNERLTLRAKDTRLPDAALQEAIRDMHHLLGQLEPKSSDTLRFEFMKMAFDLFDPPIDMNPAKLRRIVQDASKKLHKSPKSVKA